MKLSSIPILRNRLEKVQAYIFKVKCVIILIKRVRNLKYILEEINYQQCSIRDS